MKFAVRRVGENTDRGLLALHQHGNGRRHHIGRVRADEEIDLVDLDQLRIDRRHVRGAALIVVVDELDRSAHQPAFGVDVVAPDLQCDQHLLADRGDAAGQRHAEPDLYGISGPRRQCKHDQREESTSRA
jgi:hypothetical protein